MSRSLISKKKKGQQKKKPTVHLPSTAEELSEVLGVFVSAAPVQDAIDEGAKILKEFMKSPDALFPMLEQITEHPDPNLRQIAAVVLYSRIDKYWNDPKTKGTHDQVKQMLVDRINHEEHTNARNAVTHLAIAITDCESSAKPWTDLLETMLNLAQSENIADVQTGVLLLRYLGHSRSIADHREAVIDLLFRHSQSSAQLVRSRSLAALYRLFTALRPYEYDAEAGETSSILPYAARMPELISLLAALIEEGDEPSIGHMFSILTLFEETNTLGDYVHSLLEHICHYASQAEIAITVRAKATDFLRLVLETRPIVIQTGDHYERLFSLATALLSEEDDECGAGDANETAQGVGVYVLEHALRVLPRGAVLTPLLDLCNSLYQSDNSWSRKAALVSWSVMFETSPEEITDYEDGKYLTQLVHELSERHPHEDVILQIAYCRFVSNYASYLPEEASLEIDVFMPALIATFRVDPSTPHHRHLISRCMSAVDCCASALGTMISKYASEILSYVAEYIHTADTLVRAYSMDTLASIVEHSSSEAATSFDDLKTILVPTILACDFRAAEASEEELDEEVVQLRNSATQALGALLVPVQAEKAFPVVEECLPNMFDALIFSDDYDVKESTFQFLGQVARTFKGDLSKELSDRIILACVQTLSSDEGVNVGFHDDDEHRGGSLDGYLNENSDEDEENEEEALERKLLALRGGGEAKQDDADYEQIDYEAEDEDGDDDLAGFATQTVDQGALHVKSAAQMALIRLMEGLGAAMDIKNVRVILTTILHLFELPALGRRHVCTTLRAILNWCHDHYPNPEGVHQGVMSDYHPDVRVIVNSIVATVAVSLEQDDDADSATALLHVLTLAVELFGMIAAPGPHVLIGTEGEGETTTYLEGFWTKTMINILEEKTQYLIQGENAIEGSSFGESVMVSYFDYLGQLARAQGEHFLPFFDSISTTLVQNVIAKEKNRPGSFRASAVGTFAELFDFCGQYATHYLEVLPPLTLEWLQDDYTEVARNAAYLAGGMFRAAGEGADASLGALIPAIFDLYGKYRSQRETERVQPVGCLDNCASALMKALYACPHIIPDIQEVLQLVLSECVPFASDIIEANAAYPLLSSLYERYPEAFHPFVPNLVAGLTKSVMETLITHETERSVAELFHRWHADVPALVEQGQSQFTEEDVAKAFVNLMEHGVVDA